MYVDSCSTVITARHCPTVPVLALGTPAALAVAGAKRASGGGTVERRARVNSQGGLEAQSSEIKMAHTGVAKSQRSGFRSVYGTKAM